MKITFAVFGKTADDYLKSGENIFINRLKHYSDIKVVELPLTGKSGGILSKGKKASLTKQLTKLAGKSDYIVLLDERGNHYSSVEFAAKLQELMNRGIKHILFLSGGPYGFDEELVSGADMRLSLSRMTFSHQMVRLFFLEQLYRAFTIMRGEKYHNE